MDIRILNYDEYENTCEREGLKPHTEEQILEIAFDKSKELRHMNIGMAVILWCKNGYVEEYYSCCRTEEGIYEMKFKYFVDMEKNITFP